MTQHRYARLTAPELSRNEVTDIIPFNEFGELSYLDDLEFSDNSAFDKEAQVLRAPELDDLNDTDDVIPQWLAIPRPARSHDARFSGSRRRRLGGAAASTASRSPGPPGDGC